MTLSRLDLKNVQHITCQVPINIDCWQVNVQRCAGFFLKSIADSPKCALWCLDARSHSLVWQVQRAFTQPQWAAARGLDIQIGVIHKCLVAKIGARVWCDMSAGLLNWCGFGLRAGVSDACDASVHMRVLPRFAKCSIGEHTEFAHSGKYPCKLPTSILECFFVQHWGDCHWCPRA